MEVFRYKCNRIFKAVNAYRPRASLFCSAAKTTTTTTTKQESTNNFLIELHGNGIIKYSHSSSFFSFLLHYGDVLLIFIANDRKTPYNLELITEFYRTLNRFRLRWIFFFFLLRFVLFCWKRVQIHSLIVLFVVRTVVFDMHLVQMESKTERNQRVESDTGERWIKVQKKRFHEEKPKKNIFN